MAIPQPIRRPAPGLAILVSIVQVVGTLLVADRGYSLYGDALLAAAGLVLVARKCYPSGVLVLAGGLTAAYHTMGYPAGITFLAPLVAVYAAVAAGRRRVIAVVAVICFVLWLIGYRPGIGETFAVIALFVLGSLLMELLVVIGRFLGQAARQQAKLAEERKKRQSSEERLRIARELHDVLGHHLSLINVRAGVGLHLMDRRPEQARTALDTIKSASAEALREVRSVLDALYPAGEAVPRAPAPGLDRLTDLTHDAGLDVHSEITGWIRPIPAEIDRAAYRIVQEALTNVRRHAGPGASAVVSIRYQQEMLVIRVEDNGAGAAALTEPAAFGSGINGMRERATSLRGSLSAGPLPGRGWYVSAEFPLPPEAGTEIAS